MSFEAVQVFCKIARMHGHDIDIQNLDDPSYSMFRAMIPWVDVLGKLKGLNSDSRETFSDFPNVLSEVYRSPLLSGYKWDLLRREAKSLISECDTRLRSLEDKGIDAIGPPFNTMWEAYYKDRFLGHYEDEVSLSDSSSDSYYRAMNEVKEKILSFSNNRRLQPLSVIDCLARRRVDSNLGIYHMKSIKSMEDWETYMLVHDITQVIKLWDSDTGNKRFAVLPGTRIQHAALGSAAEEYNRVILAMDIYSYISVARWALPILDAFRYIPEFQAIFGWKSTEELVQNNPDYHFISLDTSRMDSHVKYSPYGVFFSDLASDLVDLPREVICSDVWACHHPTIFTPTGIFSGSIGNASGSASTTIVNTWNSYALASTFCDENGIARADRFIGAVGDDVYIAVKKRKYSFRLSDASTLVAEHWKSYGYVAKKEKQLASEDTLLFLKRYFSRDPRIGRATMLFSNVLRKLVYVLPSQFNALYSTSVEDSLDVAKLVEYMRILSANKKVSVKVAEAERKGEIAWFKPPGNALWPYYVTTHDTPVMFAGWEGPYGPVSYRTLSYAQSIEVRCSIIPNVESAYMLGVCQALGQIVTHPQFTEICLFLSKYMAFQRSVDWVGFVAGLGADDIPGYDHEGGLGPTLLAASCLIKACLGEVPKAILLKLSPYLQSLPLEIRTRIERHLSFGIIVSEVKGQRTLDSGDRHVMLDVYEALISEDLHHGEVWDNDTG